MRLISAALSLVLGLVVSLPSMPAYGDPVPTSSNTDSFSGWQKAYVYRNGVLIGVATVSAGRPGHLTPTGVFTILQKQKEHRSTIYDGAPMPYMERLTWGGIALHAGGLPGYPESHGCVFHYCSALPVAAKKRGAPSRTIRRSSGRLTEGLLTAARSETFSRCFEPA